MELLGKIIEESLGPRITERCGLASDILDLWSAILPRHLADNCKPVMLVGGVLTIETSSPSYSFDLHCESPNILAALRRRFGGKIRKLNIVLEGRL